MSNNGTDLLLAVFADLFDLDPASLTDEDSQDTIAGWDSLGMVNLLVELESSFGVDLAVSDLVEFRTIGDVRRVLRDKKGVAI